jgi:ribosomal-protein-alanine N-acetyltransferase
MMHLDLPEQIETERLLLQRARYEEAEEIFYAYASKPEATKYVSWPTHTSIEDTRSYLRFAVPAWNKGIDYAYTIRLRDSFQLAGSIAAPNEDGKVQFGYILSPAKWGKGYATEACQALLGQLRKDRNVYRIWTLADAENISSINVLRKCGLKEEAKLEKWMRFINQGNNPKDCILFNLPLTG